MKNLIKISCIALFLVLNMKTFSQSITLIGGISGSKVEFGPSTLELKDRQRVNPGFHVGTLLEIPLSNQTSLNTGFLLESRGYRMEEGSAGDEFFTSTTPIYLSVPLNFKLSFKVQDFLSLYGQVGPYVGFGIGGKTAIHSNGDKITESMFNSDRFDVYQRLDYGLNIGAGAEINKILIGLGFDLGMGNLAKSDIAEVFMRNRTLKLSVGFKLGK